MAFAALLTLALVPITSADATTIAFHDFTYDHLVVVPQHALRCHEAGTTVLAIEVGRDGIVSRATVTKSSGFPDLDVAAKWAVLGWRYRVSKTGANDFPHEVSVVVRPNGPQSSEGECSAEATAAVARAMEAAPPLMGQTPKGISEPELPHKSSVVLDLGRNRDAVCGPMTVTKTIDVTISADGSVRSTEPHESWGVAKLDDAALDLVKGLHFRPARLNGSPFAVTAPVWATPRPKERTLCEISVMM